MPNSTNKRLCLATVTSSDFLSGTLVLLHTFQKTNPWFVGDFVIIQNGLTAAQKAKFAHWGERIKWLYVAPLTQNKLDQLTQDVPRLASRIARFHSIELFRLSNYDKVLFCDSDMMFCASVESIFNTLYPLQACADGSYFRGNARDRITYAEVPRGSENALLETFNAGFMVLDREMITDANYRTAQKILSSDYFAPIQSDHTDQIIYNLMFGGKQHLLDGSYNYLLAFDRSSKFSDMTTMSDAKVLHFNGQDKPWQLDKAKAARDEKSAAFKCWYTAFAEAINIEKAT